MASENETLEQEDVRGRALMRLGIAGVVTATALGALWWLDQDRKPEPPRVSTPAPIVTAPPREMAPPMTEQEEAKPAEEMKAEPGTPVDPAVAPPPATAPASAVTTSPAPARQEAPPPPKVSSTPKAPAPIAAPIQPRPTPPLAAQIGPAGERYVLQLGVFSDPKYAVEMVQKLKKQGVQAHTETRVHLGPFASRAEAEKAQEAMRRLGLQGMVMGATK